MNGNVTVEMTTNEYTTEDITEDENKAEDSMKNENKTENLVTNEDETNEDPMIQNITTQSMNNDAMSIQNNISMPWNVSGDVNDSHTSTMATMNVTEESIQFPVRNVSMEVGKTQTGEEMFEFF